MNKLSYWFPKIEFCGIKVPETLIFQVPDEIILTFYCDNPEEDFKKLRLWIETFVKPQIQTSKLRHQRLFIKNAVFSNKFNAHDCFCSLEDLATSIMNLNYAALCLGANGCEELVVRSVIPHNMRKTPCIYNGLPLRPEFRVFYDFDKHRLLYSVNYWDYEYVSRGLYDVTDKIIFDYMKDYLESSFLDKKTEVENLISNAMLKVHELIGIWSIDLLLDDNNEFWLIDMALAQNSAYWDEDKALN